MATYTGVADANGDFTIPFSTSYTSGQKVTVKAEKEGAEKTIELYAPSSVIGGGVIQFSGSVDNFPYNIGGVTLASDIVNFPENSFSAESSPIWSNAKGLIIEGSATSLGAKSFYLWGQASSLILPPSIVSIGFNCFNSWQSMLSLSLPDSVKTIGNSAFYSWTNCKSLIFNEALESIGDSSFLGWTNCNSIVLPNSLKTIGPNAFQNWRVAEKLTLGTGLISISSYAFYGWNNLKEVIINATVPPTLGDQVFTFHESCVFKVPLASLSAYQTAPGWSNYSSRMVGY